jgi:hypothetical protein
MAPAAKKVKPGIKTTELAIVVLTDVGVVAASLGGVLSPKYAALAASVSAVAYSLSRGLTKFSGAS